MTEIARGWLVSAACGWAVFPFLHACLGALPDRGYAISRIYGVTLAAWIAFLIVAVTGRPLGAGAAMGSVVLLGGASCAARHLLRRGAPAASDTILVFFRERRALILTVEALVLGGWLLFSWLLSRNPAVDPDSERFMDYAFLKAALRSPGLPVADPWFASEPIHYYHFAYLIAAFLVRAAGADPSRMFTALVAHFHTLVWAGAFGLGLALTGRRLGGLLSAWFVLGAGNFEWLRQARTPDGLKHFDWFASSRVISGGITECPWFSLLWGDLHPYVAALPIFLAALCACRAWLGGDTLDGTRQARTGRFVLVALGCGALLATHPWDLPCALLAAGLWALSRRRRRLLSAIAPVLAAGVGGLLFWPFVRGMGLSGRGVALVGQHTAAAEWLMAYGPFVLLGVLGLPLACGLRRREWRRRLATSGEAGRFALGLGCAGLTAAILCELVYVRDLFSSGDLARMNTIFKMYRIAWVCLAIAGVSLTLRSMDRGRAARRALTALLVGCGLLAGVYPVLGTSAWLKSRHEARIRAEREGRGDGVAPWADAEALFRSMSPGDAGAAALLSERALPGEAVLESSGEPYTWSGRIATFSGVPDLLGWGNHEAVWRNDWAPVLERRRDIDAIYADPAGAPSRETMRRLRIGWVVVGEPERRQYGDEVAARFARLADTVLEERGTILFRMREER